MKNIVKYILITLASVGVCALATYYYQCGGNTHVGITLERIAFCTLSAAFITCFYDVIRKVRRTWIRILLSITSSLTFTSLIILINNYWRYLYVNCSLCLPTSFSTVIKEDLIYSYGRGEYRYPLLLAVYLLVCHLMSIVFHPEFKSNLPVSQNSFFKKMYRRRLKRKRLSEVYFTSLERNDPQMLIDYVEALPRNKEEHNACKQFMDEHENDILILLYLLNFSDFITKEEYLTLREKYKAISAKSKEDSEDTSSDNDELPIIFEIFDVRFGNVESEEDQRV